jgi:NADPH:quinone reductase-like Zn-dependent oxidoreductase
MVSMVLEGAKQMAKGQTSLAGYEIVNMRVEKAMIVPTTAHGLEMALNIKRDMSRQDDTRLGETHEFSIYSKHLDAAWERNATGFLRFRQKDGDWDAGFSHIDDKSSQLQQSCAESMTPRQLYELLDTVGMNYGPLFQNIVDLRKGGDSCIAKVRVPDTKSKMPAKFEYPHLIHPATLDSMFQTLFAIEPVPMVPTFIESLFVSSDMEQAAGDSSVFCGSSTAQRTGLSGARADIAMKLDNTESYVVINGLHLTAIAGSAEDNSDFLPNHRNLCTEIVWKEDISFTSPGSDTPAIEHLKLVAHKFPDLEILQVGGGLHVTECILQELAPEGSPFPKFARYTIADTGDGSGSNAMRLLEGTSSAPYFQLAKVDGSEHLADYHCILVVAGAGVDPDSLTGHLKPGGWMLTEDGSNSVVVGASRAYLDYLDTMKCLGKMKFNRHTVSSVPDRCAELVLLCHPNGTQHAREFRDALLARAPSQFTCSIAVMTLDEISQDVAKISRKVVISMLDVDCPDVRGPFVYGWTQSEFEAFRALHKAAGGIIWMTRGATMESTNPEAAPIIALARTLMSEDSQKVFATFDLSQESEGLTSGVASMVMEVFKMTFLEQTTGPLEVEFAERGCRVYIPRLTTIDSLNQLIENNPPNGGIVQVPFVDEYLSLSSHGFKLELSKAGISADAFRFVTFERPKLQANEVEVEYTHALLTFRDLEAVRGLTDGSAVGVDVVGRVTRLGANVTMDKVKLETDVIALTPEGSLRNIINVDARLVVPARRGFVPSFFVSAYYSLVHMGRIHAGSKVLIHAGASSFGMAAIAVCSIAGADVYTTILGSDSRGQREILQGAGLPVDRVFDATSSNFAAAVKEATAGKGVDVVYNPTQQHTTLSVDCVRPGKCNSIDPYSERMLTPARWDDLSVPRPIKHAAERENDADSRHLRQL